MKVTHEIHIESSRDTIWDLTIDVESWPKWNPNVEKVTKEDEGNFKVGSSAVIIQKGLPPTRWTCMTLEDSTIFSWKGTAYGIKMKATHILEDKLSGVSNKLVIEATGLLVYLLWPFFKASFYKSLELENKGLKKFIEEG